jgi:hypothetical protein
MAAAERAFVAALAVVAACASPPYAPCPVELAAPWPDDAFTRCRAVLLRDYGALAIDDAARFRLQTTWVPVAEPVGERRATVFCGDPHARDGLVVVVELRRVSVPWFGTPGWSEPRGDHAAERELANALALALAAGD